MVTAEYLFYPKWYRAQTPGWVLARDVCSGVRPSSPHLTWILMLGERESQRDSAIKPRVASSELPWETSGLHPFQPRRGCADSSYDLIQTQGLWRWRRSC